MGHGSAAGREASIQKGESAAIGLEKDGELVAGVLYDHYNTKSVAMHVAAEGKTSMTRETLKVCFTYPFQQLGVKKIIGMVDSDNQAARRFDEHLGFKLEATLKDAAPKGDLMFMTMTRDECRFLEGAK